MSPADADAVARGCYFDESAAERVRTFFRRFLRHSKGEWAGKPFELLPWQWEKLIKPLFGWKRADGTRRYRRAYIEIPKKNGKSSLCAGIVLYLLLADDEPGAETYSAAADRQQASIVFNEVLAMVKASPALAAKIKATPSTKRLRVPSTNSSYTALSADVPTKEGLNIHGLIFDELHAQRDRKLWDTLAYGGAARRQPLSVAITTAGDDKESLCYQQHEYARKVIAGEHFDPGFFGLIYSADEKDDWKDPAMWAKANPSLGTALKLDALAADCLAAQLDPASELAFRRYRLNQWIKGRSANWLPVEVWDACGGEVDKASLANMPCYGGLDMSSTQDLAAFVLYWPHNHAILPVFWLPSEAGVERDRRNKPRLDQWVRSGHIREIEGHYVRQDVVLRDVLELSRTFRIVQAGFDPWNAIELALRLREEDVDMVEFRQGFASMSPAMKKVKDLIVGGDLRHGGHPVMRFCFCNLIVETDAAENVKPAKNKSRDRIDGFVALVMAVGQSVVHQVDETVSVYETKDLLIL